MVELKFNSFQENSLSAYVFIPERKSEYLTGTQFCQNNMTNSINEREENILQEFIKGNVPEFIRNFKPVIVTEGSNIITYMVSSDYMSIGTDEDYVRMPMSAPFAQQLADKFNCSLITTKMSNDIWLTAENKLEPKPKGPPYDLSMMSMKEIMIHNGKIQNQLLGKDYTALTAGIKKDVVISNKLSPNNPKKRVAVYGWHQLDGVPIQGLNAVSHERDFYLDYSHGVRLVAKDVLVNDILMNIEDVFKNPSLSNLVSNEGVLTFLKY